MFIILHFDCPGCYHKLKLVITTRSSWFGLSSGALQTCCCCATGNSGHDPRIGSGELWWTAIGVSKNLSFGHSDLDSIVSLSGHRWYPYNMSFGFQDFINEHEGSPRFFFVFIPCPLRLDWKSRLCPWCMGCRWCQACFSTKPDCHPKRSGAVVAGLGLCADRTWPPRKAWCSQGRMLLLKSL